MPARNPASRRRRGGPERVGDHSRADANRRRRRVRGEA
ncbi:hypothetical protein LG3211_4649 [Lysobacter gummosus]|nr:hypothetical protein LG3211_4649 [Lysobacter gummosus]